jgi:hypothetical protein
VATRNLARTVVEGGRAGYSKLERKLRNRSERRLRFDVEGNVVCGRLRRATGRGFADRLAPLKRWLGRHVGRGWNNVHRDFCERFDRRSTKGWHLEDHLLQMVGRGRYEGWPFFVDSRGILRRKASLRRQLREFSFADEARALAWAAGRRVIVYAEAVFWTARTVDSLAPASPQGRRLTPGELGYWYSLAPEVRQKLSYRPGRGSSPPR